MEYMSAREAADKWGISQRRVAVLCSENRINNATMVGNMWIIPAAAEKPVDARSMRYNKKEEKTIKPFLKWAGGKGQLLRDIEKYYYPFENGIVTKYAEPFLGGGAVLFDILSKYELEEVYVSDINPELVNAYCMIRDDIDELVTILKVMQDEFIERDKDERKIYYMTKREL
ncbi:MAG: DNA adenine methylase, partial [Dialister sp.]|nr:DNA adenine methylase [Dialister sp.]